ncbi:arylsulfatase [Verrucomicrobiales bacterium BCK34]|nr:arylsulfatase [Verrucomicrobiales bacterium BCK34]
MNIRTVLTLSILAGFHLFANAGENPNVIIVMTDDQGYPELSAHGNPILETPNMDTLHSGSVRLSDFHVAPMCTPTRGQLLTGIDAAKNGAINVSAGRTLLRPELPTIADIYKEAGYRTGLFGKWHLGDNYPFRPADRGFEETLWFPSSHINSVPDVWNNDYFDDTYTRNGTLTEYKGYCTDVFFDEAISWMKDRAEAKEPFLTYLPTNAPHSPYWVPEEYTEAMEKKVAAAEAAGVIKGRHPQKRSDLIKYLAMIKNIDDNIGKLDQFLKDSGLFENTILVFLTDNGSTLAETYYPAGMRGRKTQLWEGGHRVPCFIRWPEGDLKHGTDLDGLTEVQDLLPTLLELSGIETEASFDGIDLTPSLRGEAPVDPDRTFIINYSRMPFSYEYPAPDSPSIMRREMAGVLWKRWRLLEDKELYNLETDPLQQKNVINAHALVAARMRKSLDQWWDEVGEKANEPQRVIIGHEAENPTLLTACEWLDVFVDQQSQIRRATLKNSYWELDVAEAGEYEFELRRWPRDSGLALRDGAEATEVTDGQLEKGTALDIAKVRMKIGQFEARRPVAPDADHVTFTGKLNPGPKRLYTWFLDSNNEAIVGAYYVYIKRK